MNYPKALMRKKEMISLGFPETYLDRAAASPGQSFAFKLDPSKKNSPYIFNTLGFEEWRKKDEELQAKARKMRTQVM